MNYLEVQGNYCTAKVFTKTVEKEALDQIKALCDMEYAEGSKVRIMPDVHAGAGSTIGTTMTIQDKIVPNMVGVDIGCGMETIKLADKALDLEKLDKLIYDRIPAGFNVREKPHEYIEMIDLDKLRCKEHVDLDRAEKSIGTLGGGNHFIEANIDDDHNIYIVVHSGSRHLGLQVASYYQNLGYKNLNKNDQNSVDELVKKLTEEGRQKEIQREIKKRQKQVLTKIPKPMAYVEGEAFESYLYDMELVQKFAVINRKAMVDEIITGMNLEIVEQFTTIHNYIDVDKMILRKGAISAEKGEKFLIPINMRDGSLICIGKGNEDWNYSAPHGAGRLMSRTDARKMFNLKEVEKEMKGIYTTSVNTRTIDEAPMAYKDMTEILENIIPTAEVIVHLKPIYNFKA